MDSELLRRLFGHEQRWHGPCTIVMDAEAAVNCQGQDSILGGGAKQFAPRMVSGRISADAACLMPDGSAVVILQQQKHRQPTGEESIKQTLTVADPTHVVAIEFADTTALASLGLTAPALKPTGSHSGVNTRPF